MTEPFPRTAVRAGPEAVVDVAAVAAAGLAADETPDPTSAGPPEDLSAPAGRVLPLLLGGLRWWTRKPLYSQILLGLLAGVATGLLLGPRAGWMDLPSRLILRLLVRSPRR